MFLFRKIWRALFFLKHPFWDLPFCLITNEIWRWSPVIFLLVTYILQNKEVSHTKVLLSFSFSENQFFRIEMDDCFSIQVFLSWVLYCKRASTILCKIFSERLRNQAKLNKTEKLWYLILRIFWQPVPKIYFCNGDWAFLGCVPIKFPNFPIISLFSYIK